MIDKKLKFTIDNLKLFEENSESNFSILSLDFFASGPNLNDYYISDETLLRTADTIKNCPIVWQYSSVFDDATTHSKNEIPAGFVPENKPITNKKLPDGRIMLNCVAYVWKKFSGELLNIFQRDKDKPISVEMSVLGEQKRPDGLTEITDFFYDAVTILGELTQPAIKNASATVLQFSQEYQKDYNAEFNKYDSLDMSISSGIKATAQKGLDYYKKFGKGGSPTSLAVARHLVNNNNVSPEKVHHIAKTHKSTKFSNMRKNPPSENYISYMLYGGAESKDWSIALSDKLSEIDGRHLSYFEEAKMSDDIDDNNDDIDEGEDFAAIDNGTGEAITVDKSKDSLSNTAWGSVDKTALMHKVLKAKNYKSLVKDVYAQVDEGWEDHPSSSLHYPIMQIIGNKAVYNRSGLSAALGRAKAQNESGVVSKVNGIYGKLGLDKPEKEVNNSMEDVKDEKKEEMATEEKPVEKTEEMAKEESKEEAPKTEEMAKETPDDKKEEEKETPEEEKKESPAEEEKEKKEGTEKKMSLESYLDTAAILQMLEDETDGYKELVGGQDSEDFAQKLMSAMYAKMCKLSAENQDMCGKMAKMSEDEKAYMSELDGLKEFKADQEKQQFAVVVDSTLKEIETNTEMPKDEMEALREESKNFNVSTASAWQNIAKAKAFAYAIKTKKDDGPKKIGLPWGNGEKVEKKSIWGN